MSKLDNIDCVSGRLIVECACNKFTLVAHGLLHVGALGPLGLKKPGMAAVSRGFFK